MGYTKLFSSIVGSTLWRGPKLHVKVVWITMLAMKDQDGIVEASIPGLADFACVTVEQVEEALAVLMAPDPYSRTKDHEGRRIAEVDGGWVVLNHFKYRDKEDHDERRRKDAERQQRKRDRERHASSRSVTPDHGESPDLTTSYTDTDPEEGPPSFPDQGSRPSQPPDPDRGPPRDLVQGPSPVDRGGVRAAGSKVPQDANPAPPRRVSGSVVVKPDPARLARQALVERFRARMKVARAEIIGMYRLRARTEIPLMGGEDEVDLRRRLEEAGDQAEAMLEHAMELAIAEARKRKPPSVQWLGWIIGRSRVWNRLQRMSIDDIESSDKDGQSVFDMLDEMRAELVAKEKP